MANATPVLEAIDQTLETKRRPPLDVVYEWVSTVDHKKIGLMYIAYALLFLLIGGFEAVLIRIQLAVPNNHFVSPQAFNRLFTMHGTTMVFFMGMPILFGFGNYLVPLMIGARDMAFPRLNAFSFWISAFGGLLLYFSYLGGDGLYGMGSAPDVGWFAYAPLTARIFSPGHSTDYWTLSLLLTGIGTTGTALNIMTTTICMRCKGMKLTRMPLFVWLMVVTSFLVFVAVSPLTAAQIMLTLDRYLGAHFFDTQAGGSAVLWMHFFWIFGHPEVYILVLPAFGFVSEILPVFSRKAIFGYPAMVAATVAIGFISLSVWAHHMFTVGMPVAGQLWFMYASLLIAVPTGVKVFNWIATMWEGSLTFETPMLFAIGFIFVFVVGGCTGVIMALASVDIQLHQTYYIVAHFHYTMVAASLFALFAGTYYWLPKWTGHMYDETLGRWHFWLSMIFFNITFFPMHFLGLAGMPRRIPDYPLQFADLNMIASIGAFGFGLSQLLFLYTVIKCVRGGPAVPARVWDGAKGLEWTLPSPPPHHSFETPPVIA
jgi:cytochrome c oxidase subunit 1